jgi:hydrogenase expression/formation protein HypE
MDNIVTLRHGDGGKYTSQLIRDIFYKHFNNHILISSNDSAVFEIDHERLAFTTDSFVVKPIIFPGGNIGKLAVCGTVNDLTTAGAIPLYLSCGFIIEEGFKMDLLETIAQTMGETCKKVGVKIITGDTKIVERGSIDGIFINTTGLGIVQAGYQPKPLIEGDEIIITGGIAEHGTTIAIERYQLKISSKIQSDCMPLNQLVIKLHNYLDHIKVMRDPTRGGIGTVLNELIESSDYGLYIKENDLPISNEVKSINALLGLDLLYHACEGRMVLVVDKHKSHEILERIQECEGCENARIIGTVIGKEVKGVVVMETYIGGRRVIRPLEGDMLPRIC